VKKNERKVFVFGWDAATWKIINTLRGKARLPNLERMIEQGSHGTLIAEEPLLSPSVWTTIASGKRKEKHGIFDFAVTAKHIKCKRIWDILNETGHTVGIYGHFVTWPPTPVNGFMIPGLLAPTDDTHPPELSFLRTVLDEQGKTKRNPFRYVRDACKAMGYGLSLQNLLQIVWFLVRRTLYLKKRLDIAWRQNFLGTLFRFNFFMEQYRRLQPDYAFFHAHLTDVLGHLYWRYMDPGMFPGTPEEEVRSYHDILFAGYEFLDQLLGRFRKRFGDHIDCVVISDHGMGAREGGVHAFHYAIDVPLLIERIGAGDRYRWFDHGFLINYLRPVGLSESEMQGHEQVLSEAVFAETGRKVFNVRREGVDHIFLQLNHDYKKLEDVLGAPVTISGETCPLNELITSKEANVSGWHNPEGVFIAAGPDVRRGSDLGAIEQVDIVPTLLHLFDLPAGRDMDGSVLEHVFTRDYFETHPVQYIDTYEKEGQDQADTSEVELTDEVRQRLRELGYFS
jgi:predicted AlkP superfamily phosphohydrolase/phosphomutase